ncbi:MAG: formylglycine-generating enzyme family protein [Pseudomonadota bacterium]
MDGKTCCTPSAGARDTLPQAQVAAVGAPPQIRAVAIPGGAALLGTDTPVIPQDEESPLRRRRLKPFHMMQTTVTNAMFAAFVADTGFVTEAERFGWSFVFFTQVSGATPPTEGVLGVEWWRKVEGAQWRLVNGPGSESAYDEDHPVTHVSWRDARAFATWAGGRLPNEAEWEHAARGGLGDVPFPWGRTPPEDNGPYPCNIWQGRFPGHNTGADGHLSTAPAHSFAPNGYGLYNMCGNVWEWTADPMKLRSLSMATKARRKGLPGAKLLKGGSYLCHHSYCFRYRIAARTFTTPDTTTSHQGFRLVFDAP